MIFSNAFYWMKKYKFRLKFHWSPINNIQALVHIMAWHRPGDKQLSEHMVISLLTHMRQHKCIAAWWHHQMDTFSALLALCAGNSPVTDEFPAQRPLTRSFDFFSLICAQTNGWVNNRDAGDLRRHGAHYDVIVMAYFDITAKLTTLATESFWYYYTNTIHN